MSLKWVCDNDECAYEDDAPHERKTAMLPQAPPTYQVELPLDWVAVGGAHVCSDHCARLVAYEILAERKAAARKDGGL